LVDICEANPLRRIALVDERTMLDRILAEEIVRGTASLPAYFE
jgi:hypothetical protein